MYRYQQLISHRSTFLDTTSEQPTAKKPKQTLETVLMKQLVGELKAQMFDRVEFNEAELNTPQVSGCRSKANQNFSYSIGLAKQGNSLQWDCKVFDRSGQYGEFYTDVEVFEFKARADLVRPAHLIRTLEVMSQQQAV